MNAVSVEKAFLVIHTLLDIRESTQVKNLTNVVTVEKLLLNILHGSGAE